LARARGNSDIHRRRKPKSALKSRCVTAEQIAAKLVAVRARLARPAPLPASSARALGAAALAALSALSLAAAVILGPGHAAKDATPPTIFGDR
jgi:hypothetical protein